MKEEEALTASIENNLYAYMETSAKDNAKVQNLFSKFMVHIFGVHERLEEAEAKQLSRLKYLGHQVSVRLQKWSSFRRHNSDSGDYRECVLEASPDLDRNSVDTRIESSCTNRGCFLGEPACCIL